MSTAVAEKPRSQRVEPTQSEHHLSFFGILRSEFLKFRSLTSSWVLMIVTVALMGLLAMAMAAMANNASDLAENTVVEGGTSVPGAETYALQSPGGGTQMAYLILGSLAIVLIAGEFGTKSIISTFTAAPRRSAVYAAKLVVVSVVSILVAVVSAVLGWAAAQMILQSDLRYSLFREEILFHILAIAFIFMVTSWMGLGLGALLRNNAGAIVLYVVILFVLPIVFIFFPWDWSRDFMHYLPQNLSTVLLNPVEATNSDPSMPGDGPDLDYLKAAMWMVVWCAVPAVFGWLSFTARDPK